MLTVTTERTGGEGEQEACRCEQSQSSEDHING
jgi:hypothetical protein